MCWSTMAVTYETRPIYPENTGASISATIYEKRRFYNKGISYPIVGISLSTDKGKPYFMDVFRSCAPRRSHPAPGARLLLPDPSYLVRKLAAAVHPALSRQPGWGQ